MQKKRATDVLRQKLVKLITFWSDKIKMRFFLWNFFFACSRRKKFFRRNFCPPELDGDPFSTGEPQKSEFFREITWYYPQRGPPATPFNSATLWGSCCLKTTIVVFIDKNCWFYQNLKKIGTINENWIVWRWGGIYLLPICCHKVPQPICCQFVILLKS